MNKRRNKRKQFSFYLIPYPKLRKQNRLASIKYNEEIIFKSFKIWISEMMSIICLYW